MFYQNKCSKLYIDEEECVNNITCICFVWM